MNSQDEASSALFMATAPKVRTDPGGSLPERTDVAVIGAGIAGMTAACLLAEAGKSVIVLDAGQPGGGMTGRTTAHLSNAIDDGLAEMIRIHGVERARLAVQSHRAAIDFIETAARSRQIACDFTRLEGFLFAAEGKDESHLRGELAAAHELGMTDVAWQDAHPAAGVTLGACLRFAGQGRFHPLKYLAGLGQAIGNAGGRILAGRQVTSVSDGDEATVELADGAKLRAEAALVTTNVPINDMLAIHSKQAPYRTYAIAVRVPQGAVVDALYWDTADPYHYVRLQPGDGGTDWLIVGGEDHKSGQADDGEARFARLEAWARRRFAGLQAVEWRWSGQVMETMDGLAFIGRNPGERNVYIATGDSGMGMTHGTVAGNLLTDLVLGRANPWADVYDPSRKRIGGAGTYLRENLNVAREYLRHVQGGQISSPDELAPGSGAVLRKGTSHIAVYRAEDGRVSQRSAVCPHLGCIVAWNPTERCWDCPCHGSHFAPEGAVLNGPATSPLAELEDGAG